MKFRTLIFAVMTCSLYSTYSQTNTFPATGNVGIGTLTPAALFQVNGGTAQFGGFSNYARFSIEGDLKFTGTGDYLVEGERYAFRYATNQNFGLLFSAVNSRYEFRDGTSAPIFWITGSGNAYIKNKLAIGSTSIPGASLDITPLNSAAIKINPYGVAAGNTGEFRMLELAANGSNYVGFKSPNNIPANRIWTLPESDGTTGQILGTNGSGILSWVTDANSTYTAGSGLMLTGNMFSNTAPDQIVSISGTGSTAVTGTYPNFTINTSEADPIFITSPSAGIITGDISNWNTAYGWGDHSVAGYLTSYTETDPVFLVSPAFDIGAIDISNWNAAHGWGDHADAGYLTFYTETDPIFNSSLAAGINATDTINWNAAFNWGDHSAAGYLTSFTETDPIFAVSTANNITAEDVINWNEAFNWGDHTLAGYLTTYTETDPIFDISIASDITAVDTTSWNAAYSWGDHADAGYLTDYSESDPQVSSATINKVPRWNGSSLSDGLMYDNGTNVGIGTVSPVFKLDVNGDASFNGIRVGHGNGNIGSNTILGYNALFSNTTGSHNTASGYSALSNNTTGISNTASGFYVLAYNTTGSGNTADGFYALSSNTIGNNNTAFGYQSGFNNSGSGNVFLGNQAGYNETGSNKLYIANSSVNPPLIYGDFATEKLGLGTITPDAKLHVEGSVKIADGTQGAGKVLTSDASGLASWQSVAYTEADPIFDISIASDITSTDTSNWNAAYNWGDHAEAGYLTSYTETDPLFNTSLAADINATDTSNWNAAYNWGDHADVGYITSFTEADPIFDISIASDITATDTSNWNTAYGWGDHAEAGYLTEFTETDPQVSSTTANMVSKWNGTSLIDGSIYDNGTNVGIGTTTPTYKLEVSGDARINQLIIGRGPGFNQYNTVIGDSALSSNYTGEANTAIGFNAMKYNDSGYGNTATGFWSMQNNLYGMYNTAYGGYSLLENIYGYSNTAIGSMALRKNLASENTAVGNQSLTENTNGWSNTAVGNYSLRMNTSGGQNTVLGTSAGENSTNGSGNVFVGFQAGQNETGSNKLYIANSSANPPLIYGDFATAKLGLGTITPDAKLHVEGNVKIADGTHGAGKVLTSDSSGLASWQNVTVSEIDPQVSSATTNMVPKWNGTTLTDGLIYDDGLNVGIGTSSPTYKFQVNAAALINGIIIGQGAGLGGANVVVGNASMINNVSGNNNTTLGSATLMSNTTGSFNTSIGSNSMYGNIEGTNNTAIGYNTLSYGENGNYNTAVGSSALIAANGFNNSALGWRALMSAGSVNNNTAIGAQSLEFNQTGSNNSALGYGTLWLNTSGTGNAALGLSALAQNTEGSNNTAIGAATLLNNVTGTNNVAIGYLANVGSGDLTNATAVGSNAITDASNKVRIGNTSVNSIGGEVGWTSFSDERMKKDIRNDVPGLVFINQLKPVTYHIDLKKQNELMGVADTAQWNGKYDIEQINFTGFLAQEVDKAAQNIGYDFSGIDKTGSIMGLRYSDFVVPLTKAAQELDAVNRDQDAEIAVLQETIIALQQQISDLTNMINIGTTNDGAAEITIGEGNNTAMLGQNIPNPYDQSTLIPFRIPKNCKDASIMITDPIVGRVITIIPISCSETHIVFEVGELTSGMYNYSLFVDGQLVGSKEMIITR